ncbi:MAG: VWA domain-containing protein, partial [Planctomycetota bacterium]|nr:VWA domain-containing protein [Planctomycetota bacterium]
KKNWLKSGYYRRDKPSDQDLERLREFLKKDLTKDPQGWGAFNSFYLLSQYKSLDKKLLSIPHKDKSLIRRAAMLEALGYAQDDQLIEIAKVLIPKSQKIGNKYQKAIITESLAWAVARYCSQWYRPKPVPKKPVKKPVVGKAKPGDNAKPGDKVKPGDKKPVSVKPKPKIPAKPIVKKPSPEEIARKKSATEILLLIIDLVDNRKLLERTRRDLSLALQYCFGSKFAYEDPESWKAELLRKKTTAPKSDTTVVRFMGIEDRGKRIVFLLDASDSMLNPLTDAEKKALEKLLPKASSKKSVTRGTRPWDNIETRFDAARLHLQHTLLNMSSKVSFSVVLFGNDAELLSVTPGFMKASKRSASVVMKELWDIKAGPSNTARPHGTLKGQTNIYQAFALAFRIGKRGERKCAYPYVDKKLYFEGAETIYLLSDGKPTRDGFSGQTPKMKTGGYWLEPYEGEITDPETGIKRKIKRDKRIFVKEEVRQYTHGIGPYNQYDLLIGEIARMNMFRKVVIHVIGLGEADKLLPKRIAEIGRGRWIHVSDQ